MEEIYVWTYMQTTQLWREVMGSQLLGWTACTETNSCPLPTKRTADGRANSCSAEITTGGLSSFTSRRSLGVMKVLMKRTKNMFIT
ncbi:hypothetical protein GDO78_000853 [Eleutherodactylus coqui]|uniref:Uncharacterized protein n=1 Tax=Eleutherodactylus coqui TaxID=57060 RepID=A0A8J6KI90_ELECQ|nr:hypothetical protein GDO78_000853 [Eleutherodactylus coqui]